MSAVQKDRTCKGKTYNLVRKHTKPSAEENGWQWLTRDFMESDAFRTLSGNAHRALFRILIEHVSHAALCNGRLIVTHTQFIEYGVTGEYVADATGELEFKGIIRVQRGKAGDGTSHPNTYRLTFTGDHEGAPATNEWRRCTMAMAKAWSTTVRKQQAEQRGKLGRKKKTPLRTSEMSPLRSSEMRKVSR
ncbi:MAG: hypothetical protein E5Y61_32435 [Mesorhizobium sp.]|nr:MAG: hypothetical protein E5Y61_32435 [Mesorhizobium sp.]TIM66891.1 MAG: hypothetical protein E5Y60_18980 [Mesorhizobium sp.]